MRRAIKLTLAASLALGAVAAGEGDVVACDDPTDATAFPVQEVWFHEGDAKVGNAGAAPFDTTPPAASVQEGAGAGALSVATSIEELAGAGTTEAYFAGEFEGCIDTLAVTVFSFDPTNRSGTDADLEPNNHNFAYTLTIDGVDVLAGSAAEAATTFANDGFGPNENRFALEVAERMQRHADRGRLRMDGTHLVELRVSSWYANTGHAVYVWDTTEVPSGMVFNAPASADVPVVN